MKNYQNSSSLLTGWTISAVCECTVFHLWNCFPIVGLSRELYSDEAHFVLELVQNAGILTVSQLASVIGSIFWNWTKMFFLLPSDLTLWVLSKSSAGVRKRLPPPSPNRPEKQFSSSLASGFFMHHCLDSWWGGEWWSFCSGESGAGDSVDTCNCGDMTDRRIVWNSGRVGKCVGQWVGGKAHSPPIKSRLSSHLRRVTPPSHHYRVTPHRVIPQPSYTPSSHGCSSERFLVKTMKESKLFQPQPTRVFGFRDRTCPLRNWNFY